MALETPRIKRARYTMREGSRADVDRLRERYEGELKTPGITSGQRRDLETSLAEIDKHLWGDRPALRAIADDEPEEQPGRRLHHRVASATAIHGRRAGAGANRYLGLGTRRASVGARRRYQQTGIPAGAESVAQFTMRTIGWIAGLSFLYVLLTPKGSRAVQLASSGGVHALQALISPGVDPLRATRADVAAAQSANQPLGQAFEGMPTGIGSTIAGIDQAVTHFAKTAGHGATKPQTINHSLAGHRP